MRNINRFLSLFLLLFAVLAASAQTGPAASKARRSPAQIRAAVAQKLGAERAARLTTVDEREVIGVLTDSLAGFAVVGYNPDFPAVLAYGDGCINMDNPSPEFLYLLDLYEQALSASDDEVETARAKAPAKASSINMNIGPLLSTTWAQRSPYNLRVPTSGGKHMLTGCVATAFAQVFKFYERPKKMHGYRRYRFSNPEGQSEYCDYDFSTASFDWGNMPKKLKDDGFLGIGNTNATENNAVSELMYATGVLSSMNYGLDGSGAYTDAAAACIDAACEDLSAYYTQYEDDLVMEELRAGRPVIYGGTSEDGGGHCFVIDGCRSDGYLHCNLGWDGTDDGYYLPTDMKGYKFYQGIGIVHPEDASTTYTPLSELARRTVRANRTAATTLEPNRWYVLWNTGRCASPTSKGVNSTVTNIGTIPAGETSEICAGQLVRFVPIFDNQYYIQTGLGDYWNAFVQSGSRKTTAEPQQAFTVASFQDGYFYMKSGNLTVDSDGIGGNVVGWGSSIPFNTESNASWQIYPVEIGYDPSVPPTFAPDQTYVIKNVGYSQGYLVATDAEDHPTLRGVTTDHPTQGLLQGAPYHDAPDFYSPNSFWYVKTLNGQFYLVNAGKKQGITNGGDKTAYTFSSEPKPINITVGADGLYRINSGTQAESYLCAATHLANPAAYWTTDDNGSKWTIEPMDPYVHVTELQAENAQVSVPAGAYVQLAANALPATAHDRRITWTSLNTAVATVDEQGLVAGVAEGTAIIRAASVDVPSVTVDFTVKVTVLQRVTTLEAVNDGALYTLRNTGSDGYSMGYLVTTSPTDTRPTLRGVTKVHSQGCKDEAYKTAPDFANPGSYWQILTDGYVYYLYNVGTQKFLTNGGNQTPYFLTSESVAINVSCTDGIFRFNGTDDAQSYLCAATHSDKPAAFWTADDQGSKWTVAEVEDVPFAPTTFYAFKGGANGDGATVKTIVDHINASRYNVIDLIVRGALRRQKQ